MFKKEIHGLEELRHSQSFRIPKVYSHGQIEDSAYVLLEKIESGVTTSAFWKNFAECLSRLHQMTNPHFGFQEDNYIGELPQYNDGHLTNLADFYIQKRLHPQFLQARENGFSFSSLDKLYRSLEKQIPNEPPALIHGDLWSGNYLIGKDDQPVLIDPAVAYVSREMDLAMMRLFGGFPARVYADYHQLYPLEPDWENRIGLWQLYYLLVHLNLFGCAYLPSVQRLIKKYK